MLRYLNFKPSFKLWWCHAQDLFGSQIPVTRVDLEYPNFLPYNKSSWSMLRYFNFELSFKLWWCLAQDLIGSQILMTTGGFELLKLNIVQMSQVDSVCAEKTCLSHMYAAFSIWCMQSHMHMPAHRPLVWCV